MLQMYQSGNVPSTREALRAGYRQFRLRPLFIKQILTIEPVLEVTLAIVPGQS